MEHVVFHPGPDGSPAFRRFGSLEDAVRFVEHLRNAEGVSEVSVHSLAPVQLSFRAYYKVEVPVDHAPVDVPAPSEPVLEAKAETVTEFDTPEIHKLIEDMFESMYAAHGVGLAAPQIGIGKRIAVIDVTFKEDPKAKLVLVNPEIIRTEGKHTQSEGCLSIPDFRENVTRPNKVTVRAQDANGKVFEKTGEELLARAFLHETDHLNGKLYISHVSALKRDLMKRKIRKLMKAGEW